MGRSFNRRKMVPYRSARGLRSRRRLIARQQHRPRQVLAAGFGGAGGAAQPQRQAEELAAKGLASEAGAVVGGVAELGGAPAEAREEGHAVGRRELHLDVPGAEGGVP